MAGCWSERRSVRALNTGDFAEEGAGLLVHDHDAILAADEQAVGYRVGHDVVPAAISADGKCADHTVGGLRLGSQGNGRADHDRGDTLSHRILLGAATG